MAHISEARYFDNKNSAGMRLTGTYETFETLSMAPSKSSPSRNTKRIPPPDVLEQFAEQLPDAPEYKLDDYAGTIRTLHDEKSLSFTEIVEFLAKHGIESNRSAVYRVYKDSKRERPEEPPLVDPETGEVVEE